MAKLSLADRLRKAHVSIMRHPDFCLFSGVIMLGKTTIKPAADCETPTAYTDGIDTVYCEEFMEPMTEAEMRCVVLHENLHKAFLHGTMYAPLLQRHGMAANIAADFFVNQIIHDMDPMHTFVTPPNLSKVAEGAEWLQDDKYRGWSLMQIMEDVLKRIKQGKGQKGQKGKGQLSKNFDKHGTKPGESDEDKAEQERIKLMMDQALREGQALVGMQKGNVNKSITDFLAPKIDWRVVLRDFLATIARGKDKSDWRRLTSRFVWQNMYFPSLVSERVGEICVAIDTSGSIGGHEINEFASELVSICEDVKPEKVRVLWWDTEVHGEQEFEEGQYDKIKELLKPQGGGGTDGSCVPRYMKAKKLHPEAVIMFTDGYLDQVSGFGVPVLWMVTRNRSWAPSEGTLVDFEVDI